MGEGKKKATEIAGADFEKRRGQKNWSKAQQQRWLHNNVEVFLVGGTAKNQPGPQSG